MAADVKRKPSFSGPKTLPDGFPKTKGNEKKLRHIKGANSLSALPAKRLRGE